MRRKRDPAKEKDRRLRYRYGITLDDWNKMHKEQGGRCRICRKRPSRLVVDHDHATGKVRGLLCHGCNTGIGLLSECPDQLSQAAIYVAIHQQEPP